MYRSNALPGIHNLVWAFTLLRSAEVENSLAVLIEVVDTIPACLSTYATLQRRFSDPRDSFFFVTSTPRRLTRDGTCLFARCVRLCCLVVVFRLSEVGFVAPGHGDRLGFVLR